MSWFDATGIASLAKTALKEAQKTIDKALDINEDVDNEPTRSDSLLSNSSTSDLSVKSENISKETSDSISENVKMMKQSVSNPILSTMSTMSSATTASNLWGSFTGSFFDASKATDGGGVRTAVTIAPTTGTNSDLHSMQKDDKSDVVSTANRPVGDSSGRTSSASASASASGSVELLSSPLTPPSNLTSPSTSKFHFQIDIINFV